MKRRIVVSAILVPVLFILLFLPQYIFAAVVTLICVVSAYELLTAIMPKENERIRIYSVVSAVIIPVGAYFDITGLVFTAVLLVLMCLLFVEAFFAFKTSRTITLAQILIKLFIGTVIPLMLSSLISMRNMSEGHLVVLLPAISAFITDSAAYFTGRVLGRRKAFPRVSPNKTVEGYIGGFVSGVLAMMIYGVIVKLTTSHDVIFWVLLIYGAVGAVITQIGDLAFSLIKREYRVKDYGQLLPGHGGLLDRFDSVVFAAPALYLLVTIIPAISIS